MTKSFLLCLHICFVVCLIYMAAHCRCNLMLQRCKTAVPNTDRPIFLKKKQERETTWESVRETERQRERRENYEWTEESFLIHPHPWPRWNTRRRKLDITDEVNSNWPLDDAAGWHIVTTWLVNKKIHNKYTNLHTSAGLMRHIFFFVDFNYRGVFFRFKVLRGGSSEPQPLLRGHQREFVFR